MENSIGKRIAEARRKKGVTQEELAARMGVTAQAVSKWETDIACPDITALPLLSDYFEISIDELLRGNRGSEVRMTFPASREEIDKKFLRVIVDTPKGDKVRVNLPIPLVRLGMEIGLQLPQVNGKEALKDIDFAAIIRIVDSGVAGKLVEVDGADGDHVEVFVE